MHPGSTSIHQLHKNQAPREDHRTVGSNLTSACLKYKVTFRCVGYACKKYAMNLFLGQWRFAQSDTYQYLQGEHADYNSHIFESQL